MTASGIVNGVRLEDHFGLVRMVVRSYRWACCAALDEGDLFQAGFFGLRRAAEKFDPQRGFTFSTYAVAWIRHAVLRTIANEKRLIRLPQWIQSCRGAALPPDALSLDAPLTSDPDSATRLDLIAGDGEDPREAAEAAERRVLVEAAMAELPERLRRVLVARFWEEQTLADVGDRIGRTRERVRQLEVDALARLRSALREASAP